jgi:hypothetical protein
MPNLYDEAIADAKSLKEMAERNARNKIIESISPQIRKMVERQILAEQEEEDPSADSPNLDLDPLPEDPVMAPAASFAAAPVTGPTPDPDEEVTHTVTTKTASGTEVKINVRVDKHGEASASADSEVAEGDDVDVTMNEQGIEALADMVLGERHRERPSLGRIRRQFESLKVVSQKVPLSESANFRSAYAILVQNVDGFRNHIISNGSTPDIRKKFNSIVKEIKNMSTSARFRRLLEEMESRPKLRNEAKLVFEPADLEGLDDTVKEKLRAMTFSVDLGEEDEDATGGEMPVDVADTGAGVDVAPPAPAAAPPAPSEYDLDEMDMDEMDMDMDEMYEEMDENEDMDMDEKSDGRTFHVDESMLRRELRRLREAKGGKGKNAKGIKDAMAKNFGGGDVEGLPEELNQLSESELDEELDEADKVAAKALEVAKKATHAAKEERKARVEEARTNRALKSKLVEAAKEAVALREQLEEVNLFNAKLLYVNKLMQNRDLTPRQQRAIVESLDAAKSVREAKLLYTSLTESLKSKSGTMTEGRILGSSSRSTRSASPAASLNESVEVDRWAVLAGIKLGN